MRAYRLVDWQQPPVLCDVPVPDPGPEQVLVRVAAAGACHFDLHVMEFPPGALPWQPPFTLGHENAGWVANGETLRLAHPLADDGGGKVGARAREQRVGLGSVLYGRPQLLLDVDSLGAVLLDNVGVGDRRGQVGLEDQRSGVLDKVGDWQAEFAERPSGGAQTGANHRLDVGPRVADRDAKASGQKQRGPRAAEQPPPTTVAAR